MLFHVDIFLQNVDVARLHDGFQRRTMCDPVLGLPHKEGVRLSILISLRLLLLGGEAVLL